MRVKFTADLVPVPFSRPYQSGKRRYNSARYTEFKKGLGYFALKAMAGRKPFGGLLKLSAEFYKRNKNIGRQQWGDTDNFLKAVMDSLQGVCYENDAQVVEVVGRKYFGEPKIIIELEELK